jgi:hypothetical protein
MRAARVLLLLLALAAGVRFAVPAHAQVAASLERLEIALWPEYDRPALLVIYRATLPASTPLPAQVTLPVPAAAGEPTAVAFADDQGQLLLTSYTRTVDGDWATLVIEAPSPRIQVEFYLDIAVDGAQRRIVFDWPGRVSAAQARFEVQEPAGASALVIEPAPEASRLDAEGRTTYSGSLGSLSPGTSFELRVSYVRSTQDPMLAPAVPTPDPQVAASNTPDPTWRALLAWGLAGLGLALLGAGGIIGWRRARRAGAPPPARFCHACGAAAGPADVFCRRCGTRLRQ